MIQVGRAQALVCALALAVVACGDNAPTDFDAAPDEDAADFDAEPPPDMDETAPVFVVTPASLALTEGGAAGTFTVALDRAPGESVVVTVDAGDNVSVTPTTLTFTDADFDDAQTVTVTPASDEDAADDTETVTLSATGLADGTVAVTIDDDDVLAIQATPNTLTVAEDDSGSVAVRLTAQPAADVTVTVTSDDTTEATAAPATLTFTPANYATTQNVTISGVADADTANESLNVNLSATGLTTVPVAVTVTDDDSLNIDVDPTSLSLTEGGAAGTFAVTLTQQPGADVTVNLQSPDTDAATVTPATLTFTSANYDDPQTVTVTPVSDDDTADESVGVTASATGLATQTVQVAIADDDTQVIQVDPASITVAEGGTATFDVRLAFNPQSSVTVNVASNDTTAATVSTSTITFDASNYAVEQTVTVTGVQDVDLVGESLSITLSGAGAANATVAVTVTDDDAQSLVVTPTTMTVTEGMTGTFNVSLAFQPAADVTVAVGSNNSDTATATPATLTFTPGNYATPQAVTVAGVQDADLTNDSTTITVSSATLASRTVTVNVTDDDAQNILLTTSSVSLTEGGVSANVGVRLAFDPGGSVTVDVASDDAGAATATPIALTFDSSNYSANQTVTIAPVSDEDTADEEVTVTLSATGITPATVTASVDDNDTQAFVVSPDNAPGTPDVVVTEEGATGSFTVRLAFNPVQSTTVFVTSPDQGAVVVSPIVINFNSSNYATPVTVTVTGVSDPDLVDEDVQVAVTGAGAPQKDVHVRVVEDDLQDIIVSTTSVDVTEDTGPGTFTVRLAYQPAGTVGVNVASADSTRATANPTLLVFTTTNYADPQVVTVNGTTDQDLHDTSTQLTISSPALASKLVDVDVNDDDVQRVILSPSSVNMNEGDTTVVTARLAFIPYCEQATPGCTETVTVTSGDLVKLPVSPALLAFTAASYTTPQDVELASQEDADVLNEEIAVTFDSGEATTATAALEVAVLDDDTQNFVFDAQSTVALTEGGADGTIGIHLLQDPSGTLVVTATSTNPSALGVGNDGDAPTQTSVTLSFDSSNYQTTQYVDVRAIHDVDLLDEVSPSPETGISFSATGVTTVVHDVEIADDDSQAIVAALAAVVDENGTTAVAVELAFQPTNDLVVHVNREGGEDRYTALPTSLTFTPSNWDTAQTVTLAGLDDVDLDDHTRTLTLTTEPEVPSGNDEGAALPIVVTIQDDDTQEVLVRTEPPAPFALTVQEGGPVNSFWVSLEAQPRGGTPDQVEISSDNPELELSTDGITYDTVVTLDFTTSNFDDEQQVWFRGADDWETVDFDPSAEVSDDVVATLDIPGETSSAAAQAFAPTTQDIEIIDDEITMLASASYTTLDGATRHTKRQNINWARTVAVVSAYDADGNTIVASVPRDNLGALTVGPTVGDRGAATDPVESVEWVASDGSTTINDVGVFATVDASGITYARYQEDLGGTVVSPTSVVASGAVDFWPTYDGSQFGVVWRDSTEDNLFFRTVSLAGALGTVRTVTAPTGSAHQKPNLHPVSGGGWIVLYTTAAEVRCVRLAAEGTPITGSNVVLTGVPAAAFVSSVYNTDTNRVIAAFNNPTRGLQVAQIDPADCGVDFVRIARPLQLGELLNTPFIAFNGSEYKVAYDLIDGTVGVVTLSAAVVADDDVNLGAGARPSIAWAGDRWIARFEGSVELVSGSMQTHCGDGVLNVDEEEIDCGGADCVACVAEFSFADTVGEDQSGAELFDFFGSLGFAAGPDDYLYFSVEGGALPNAGAWCAQGADWYIDNYLTYAASSSLSTVSGTWNKWERATGGSWNGPTTQGFTNSFGSSCIGAYSWCADHGIGSRNQYYLPTYLSTCESAGGSGYCGGDYGATLTIRVGKNRQQTCGF